MQNNNLNKNDNNSLLGFSAKELLKTNPITIIMMYLIIYIFGTLIISLFVSLIVGNCNGIGFNEAFKIGMTKVSPDSENARIYFEIQSYTNFFSYLLMFLVIPFFGRDYLKNEIKVFKDYKKVLVIVFEAIVFASVSQGLSYFSTFLLDKIGASSATSENELLIKNMILYGGKPLIVISTVIFAPIVEELVYRKALISILDNWANNLNISKEKLKAIFSIVISGLIFALPHMLSSQGYTPLAWLILFLVYFISGAILGVIYYYNNKNVYASWSAHTLNNLIAVINM